MPPLETRRQPARTQESRDRLAALRAAQAQRRASERAKMLDSLRNPKALDRAPLPAGLDPQTTHTRVVQDYSLLQPPVNSDAVEQHLAETAELWTEEEKRPYSTNFLPKEFDIDQRARGRDANHHPLRTRVRDLGFVAGGQVRVPRAVFARCCLCRLFQYPKEEFVDIVPEKWTIKCVSCDNRVHRHCQETVPPFFQDTLWECPACLSGV